MNFFNASNRLTANPPFGIHSINILETPKDVTSDTLITSWVGVIVVLVSQFWQSTLVIYNVHINQR